MKQDPRRSVEDLFHEALDRQGTERAAFLDGACGGDADLRARVDALLDAHDKAAGFLESPALEAPREGPGSSIGPYKLLQEIGEGGMGVVYMAEQEKPVARKVALKVIKLGMDTKQVIARFEAERQALAMMDHPNIARVLDAGATEAGRPYFVMELVRGVPISDYCDRHKLSTDERLRLFVDVCRAVQHAHQKGVIHRDLKPSNVLVTSHDGTPVPKIIDFGVAKATNRKLTERTLFTEFQQVIGTPEYMSPEQAEMSGLDIDTRSDIYSLGVLLYQLLTGTTPVDPEALRTAAFEEMTRIIREDEPLAPSTRISKLGADADDIAQRRRSDAVSLSRHFRGDLDWIVMKALEKDRTRRYDTASAFGADVQRHLEQQPVEAGPPGALYRLRKFVHRNRRAVIVAGALFLALDLGLAGTTAGFVRAREEAKRSQQISDALRDVLAVTDAGGGAAREDLEATRDRVRTLFGREHATYAAVLDTLVIRLHDAGEFSEAARLCRESLEVWKGLYGDAHPNVGLALARLGRLLRQEGKDDEAEKALRGALDILAGVSDAPGLAGYEARIQLADLLSNRAEYAEADELLGQALTLLEKSPSLSRLRILETLETRFLVQLNASLPEAEDTLRTIYAETHAFYPEDSPMLATAALGLGNYLVQRGERDAAAPYLREAIERFRACGKVGGTYYLAAHDGLFQILRSRTDPASVREADKLLRDTIELARPIWGVEHLAQNLGFYANRMLERRRFVEAIEAILEANQLMKDDGQSIDDRDAYRMGLATVAFRAALQPGEQPEVYAVALEATENALADEPDHPGLLAVLGAVLYRQGEYARALEVLAHLDAPLADAPSRFARRISPAELVFRAMAHARLGDEAAARSDLAAFRAALVYGDVDGRARELLAEAVALIEHPSSAAADE